MSIYMQLKYKTKFTDKEILNKALIDSEIDFEEQNGKFVCYVSFYELQINKNKNGEYEIKTQGYNDWQDDIIEFRRRVTEKYEKLVQKQIQKQILNNVKLNIAQNNSMKLEHEEILKDNSVLLTISI